MDARGPRRGGRGWGRWDRLHGYLCVSIVAHVLAAFALILWGPRLSGGAPPPPVPIRVLSLADLGLPAPTAPAARPTAGQVRQPGRAPAPSRRPRVRVALRPQAFPPAPVEPARTPDPLTIQVPPRPADGPSAGAPPQPAPAPPEGVAGTGEERAPAPAAPAGPPAIGTPASRGAGTARAGLPGAGGPDFRSYLELVRRKVLRAWQESYEGEGAQRVEVRLRIRRSGRAYAVQVVSSTSPQVNRGVLAAVERASPFPPIPEALVTSLADAPIILRMSLMPE